MKASNLAVLITMAVLVGCASVPLQLASVSVEERPAVDDMLRVIGRFTIAHACPVVVGGEQFLLTNSHVVDERPFDPAIGAYPVRWSDGHGNEGLAEPERVYVSADIALLRVTLATGPIARWFNVAAFAPKPGDRVSVLGYRWEGGDHVMEDRRIDARITRVIAGHAVYDRGGHPGSSGGCVLNDADEAIGVNALHIPAGLGESAGVAVGVWGIWTPHR